MKKIIYFVFILIFPCFSIIGGKYFSIDEPLGILFENNEDWECGIFFNDYNRLKNCPDFKPLSSQAYQIHKNDYKLINPSAKAVIGQSLKYNVSFVFCEGLQKNVIALSPDTYFSSVKFESVCEHESHLKGKFRGKYSRGWEFITSGCYFDNYSSGNFIIFSFYYPTRKGNTGYKLYVRFTGFDSMPDEETKNKILQSIIDSLRPWAIP